MELFRALRTVNKSAEGESTFTYPPEATFDDVVKSISERLGAIEFEMFRDILRQDSIPVSSELLLYKTIIVWFKHDVKRRPYNMYLLMKYVRFHLMSIEVLNNLPDMELLDPKTRKVIENAKRYRKLDAFGRCARSSRSVGLYRKRTRLRMRDAPPPQVLYIFGGHLSKYSVAHYEPDAEKFQTSKKKMPAFGYGTAVVVYLDLVWIIGGTDEEFRPVGQVHVFDVSKLTWSRRADMSTKRAYLGAAVLGEEVYAVGGTDDVTALASTEVYCRASNRWRDGPPMNTGRIGVGVGVVSARLYAVGGSDDPNEIRRLKSVEFYTEQGRIWSFVSELSYGRCRFGVAVIDDQLYAVGGHKSNSIEVYNGGTDKWRVLTTFETYGVKVSVAAINGLLCIVGDKRNERNATCIDCYNPKTNEWLRPTVLKGVRIWAGLAVMTKRGFAKPLCDSNYKGILK